jgi:hypothetical protein
MLLERLEDRCVPVVGANGLAAEVERGGGLDGVVLVEHGGTFGTGALLSDGRHVITAAHVVDGASGAKTITFQMSRGSTHIDITLDVPAGSPLLHSSWVSGGAANQGNDLALLTLLDQIDQQANRHLVAPFGAERFGFYTGELQGEAFTMAGYGRTGTGADGNHVDEVQRVRLGGTEVEGTFKLTFKGQTTAALAANATAAQVQEALAALTSVGSDAGGKPNVEVSDRGLPAGTWDVRFVRDLGGEDVELLTGAASGMNPVEVTECFAGGQSDMIRVKREGKNELDRIDGQFLGYDFDDGSDAHNSMGGTGLGGAEAGLERGDSGSPLLVEARGGYWVAGVLSYINTGGDRDVNNFATADGSFGGTGTYISTQSHAAGFLTPGLAGDYHLVLDMQQQVLGLDGVHEALTIRASRDGGDLVISIFGSLDPSLNGEYYRAPIALAGSRVLSLTLRGGDDDETFVVEGDLGLGSVTIDGRGGRNALEMDNASRNEWKLTAVNGGGVGTAVSFKGIESLRGGDGEDRFLFQAGAQIGAVDGGAGADRLDYSGFGAAVTTHLQAGTFMGPLPWLGQFQGLSTAIRGLFVGVEGVVGSAMRDALRAEYAAHAWTITGRYAGHVDGFSFSAVEDLIGSRFDDAFAFRPGALVSSIDAGAGSDALDYSGFGGAMTVNLQTAGATGVTWFAGVERAVGSPHADTLIAHNGPNVWSITGADRGDLNGLFTFLAFERLNGGVGRDVFAFHEGGRVSRQLTGGPGPDWLDYRHVVGGVSVNLAQRVASRTGGLAGIEHAMGSLAGASRLVGDAGHNVLVGYAGGNNVLGGSGRDFLVGGSGHNIVISGAGDDVAIGGSTAHDGDTAALEAFLAEWTRGTAYNARVNNLLRGGGLTGGRRLMVTARAAVRQRQVVIGGGRVTSPAGTIYGNLGRDFFAVRFASRVADLDRRTERVV